MPKNVRNKYRKTLTANDLITDGVTLIAGQYVELGRYEVEAGEALAVGYGQYGGQVNASGRAYLFIQDSVPAQLNGYIRIDLHSPQDRVIETVFEGRTEDLALGANDPTLRVPLPFNYPFAKENRAFVLKMNADAADDGKVVALANCSCQISFTAGDYDE